MQFYKKGYTTVDCNRNAYMAGAVFEIVVAITVTVRGIWYVVVFLISSLMRSGGNSI